MKIAKFLIFISILAIALLCVSTFNSVHSVEIKLIPNRCSKALQTQRKTAIQAFKVSKT